MKAMNLFTRTGLAGAGILLAFTVSAQAWPRRKSK